MSELRRWSEEGATVDELSLLEASRRERAPAQSRARTLQALGIAAAAATTATATATATSSSAAATAASATKGGLTVLTKIAVFSLAASGVVGGGVAVRARLHSASHSSPVAVAARPVENAVVRAPTEALPSPPASAAPSAVAPVRSSTPDRSARPSSTDDPLRRELKALEGAHQALTDHNPGEALRLLDRYQAQFPRGSLSSEATVLRAQALLASGDRAGAKALAEAYSAAHPDGPYAKRLRELVREGP
jgi:hypothetical protein